MSIKYDRLFSRRSDGGIQTWDLELDGDKYRVTSGAVGHKATTTEWTVCAGKNIGRANETSPKQQAEKEATALWQKKYDSGYRKTEEELNEVTMFDPMLAKNYDDYKDKILFPVYSQPKLDGIRCISRSDGTWTRSGKKHTTLKHIEAALEGLHKEHPGLVLDGEAYADKLSKDFSRICSLIKRDKPTAEELVDCARNIKYHVYDCVIPGNPKASFSERSKFIAEHLKGVPGIVIVDTTRVDTQAELDKLFQYYMSQGQEGQIIRIDSAYENKRSKSLLKRKEFDDAEFKILDIIEGVGNRADTCGAMSFENSSGKPFNSNVKGSWEFTHALWVDREKYIGKLATVRFFGYTPGDKIPRFPYVVGIRDGE